MGLVSAVMQRSSVGSRWAETATMRAVARPRASDGSTGMERVARGRLRYSRACGSRSSDSDSSAVPSPARCGSEASRRVGRVVGRRVDARRAGAGPRARGWRHRPRRRRPRRPIDGAELVILAGPHPTASIELVTSWPDRAPARPGAGDRHHRRGEHEGRRRGGAATAPALRFVGGHPMAGRETRGYGAAAADLFVDRPWVVVPTDPMTSRRSLPSRHWPSACGARPVRMDAATHDLGRRRRSATCRWSSPRRSSRRSPGATRAGPRRRAGRWHGRSRPAAGAT